MSKITLKNEFHEVDKRTKKVFLSIGEYHVSDKRIWLGTLLGSCIAVCLFDRLNKIGGMNHIILPGRTYNKKYSASARYSINAMELLINGMMKLGAEKKRVEAKVFGGASVISSITKEYLVGPKISKFVIEFLNTERIPVTALDIGGVKTRKIYFHTGSGEVLVRKTVSNYIHEEKRKIEKLKNIKIRNNVTLF